MLTAFLHISKLIKVLFAQILTTFHCIGLSRILIKSFGELLQIMPFYLNNLKNIYIFKIKNNFTTTWKKMKDDSTVFLLGYIFCAPINYNSLVSWPSGLVHRTQVLVLSENQNVGSIPGSGTCVLEQDT